MLQVFPEPGIMARAFPRYLSEMATQHLKEETDGAVTLIPNRMVMKLNSTPSGKIALHLDSDEVLEVDHGMYACFFTHAHSHNIFTLSLCLSLSARVPGVECPFRF